MNSITNRSFLQVLTALQSLFLCAVVQSVWAQDAQKISVANVNGEMNLFGRSDGLAR